MIKRNTGVLAIAAVAALLAGGAIHTVAAQEQQPFGGPDSVAFANQLWVALQDAGYVGPGRMVSKPYEGRDPHGAVLDTMEGALRVAGRTGTVIVKNNYGGEAISVSAVANDPGQWLKAVTVMFRREAGYDPDNGNWFWGKFAGDGRIDKNPAGALLVGRVAKGMPKGCIACHRAAPGGDYVFNHDRFK